MKILSALLATVLLAASLSAGSTRIQEPKGFAKTLSDATFALYGSDEEYGTHFLCTATAIQKVKGGYNLLSAGHCVANMPADITFSVSEQIGSPLIPVTNIKANLDGDYDISLWFLQTKQHYPVISLGDEHSERVGNKTINANFSLGLGKQISLGTISSDGLPASQECVSCHGNFFLVQEYAGPGASGSAIVSQKTHKIIGLLVAEWQGAPVGFAVEPISIFQQFLAAPDQYKDLHQLPKDDPDDEN